MILLPMLRPAADVTGLVVIVLIVTAAGVVT